MKRISRICLAVLAIACIGLVAWAASHDSSAPVPTATPWIPLIEELGGRILTLELSHMRIRDPRGTVILVAMWRDTVFADERGHAIPLSAFKVGDWVAVHGLRSSETSIVPESVMKWYPPGQQPPELNY